MAMDKTRLLLLPGTQCNEKLWTYLQPQLAQIKSHCIEPLHWPLPNQSLDEVLSLLHNTIINYLDSIPAEPKTTSTLGSTTPSLSSTGSTSTSISNETSTSSANTFMVLGFSLGGYVLARYLAKYQSELLQRQTSLPTPLPIKFVIVSHTPTSLPEVELKQRRRILSHLKNNDYSGVSRERVCQLLGPSQHQNQAIIKLIQEMDRDLGKDNLIHQLTFTGARTNSINDINRTSEHFDVSFVITNDDPLVDYEWLQNLSSKVSVIHIEGEGHMLPLEYPNELAKSLFD